MEPEILMHFLLWLGDGLVHGEPFACMTVGTVAAGFIGVCIAVAYDMWKERGTKRHR